MTNLKQLKKDFIEDLRSVYDSEEEISTFFIWLAEDIFNLKTHDLLLHTEVDLSENQLSKFEEAKQRLKKEEPVQYILGYAEFFGLKIKVNNNVLIPRPETEELVQWILEDYKSSSQSISILDIGTGSGCIPIVLKKHLNQAEVKALDISSEALKLAALNSKENDAEIEFIQKDILKLNKLPEVDILVSNPPYVKYDEQEQMRNNVLKNEPHLALFVEDEDPLIFYRKIAELASASANPPVVYVEINQYLAKETQELFKSYGFRQIELKTDFRGNDRMLKAY